MNQADFLDILQQPQQLNPEHLDELKAIVSEYPYFQSARALYLKGLKDKDSFKYNQELKHTAAYTTDRSVLFDYITSEEFHQNEISKQIRQTYERLNDIEVLDLQDISVNRSVMIDEALRQHIKATEPILDPELFTPKTEEKTEPIIDVEPQAIQQSPEETLDIGKPLEFEKTEMHSFSEWLKITSFKPIIRAQATAPTEANITTEPIEKKDVLVDKFISSKPKMPKIESAGPIENLAEANMQKQEALMTETLARIYVEQKNYEKALQAYKILSLKYPEKSGFFADQIQAVKQLQEKK